MWTRTTMAAKRARQAVQWFADDETGVAAIEYGLLAMLIAVAAIAGFKALGDSLGALWGLVAEEVSRVL